MARKSDYSRVGSDLINLTIAGFKVYKFTPYHWRVSKKGSSKVCDVWPTARKYMPSGGRYTAYYTDIVKTMEQNLRVDPMVKEAQEEVEELRSGGLEGIMKKYA